MCENHGRTPRSEVLEEDLKDERGKFMQSAFYMDGCMSHYQTHCLTRNKAEVFFFFHHSKATG